MYNYIIQIKLSFFESNKIANETLGSLKTISSFNITDHFKQKYNNEMNKKKECNIKKNIFIGVIFSLLIVAICLTLSIGLYYGGKLIGDSQDIINEEYINYIQNIK